MVIRIGTSGWVYPEWRGPFYPKGLVQRRELEFLSRKVNSIEINGSFYSLRTPANYQSWAAQVPEDFVFAVKGHRFVTHVKRLHAVAEAVHEFFDSGVLTLGPKLGPVLWQLPPSLHFQPDRLRDFLAVLPDSVRHAVEARHPSFDTPEYFALLRAHNVASVIADTAGAHPRFDVLTADFTYVRLHGGAELYASAYSSPELDSWAARVRAWAATGDVHVYFDNSMHAHAPHDALSLAGRVG